MCYFSHSCSILSSTGVESLSPAVAEVEEQELELGAEPNLFLKYQLL